MTDPLEGVTDAHLQAALDKSNTMMPLADIKRGGVKTGFQQNIISLARQIAANEKLAAELAELRAKYEPEPEPDPVKLEAEKMYECWVNSTEPGWQMVEQAIRRGMEMQPTPFTREEAWKLALKIVAVQSNNGYVSSNQVAPVARALTTPHAELLAMLGDG